MGKANIMVRKIPHFGSTACTGWRATVEIQPCITSHLLILSISMNRCTNVIICVNFTPLKKVMLHARNRCIISIRKPILVLINNVYL